MSSGAKLRYGILHLASGNFVDGYETREEADAALTRWPDCEVVDFDEIAAPSAAKVYNCPGCGLPFPWPRAMRLHWRRKHGR